MWKWALKAFEKHINRQGFLCKSSQNFLFLKVLFSLKIIKLETKENINLQVLFSFSVPVASSVNIKQPAGQRRSEVSGNHMDWNTCLVFECSFYLICSPKGRWFSISSYVDHSTKSLQQGQQTMACGPNPVQHLFLLILQTNNGFRIFKWLKIIFHDIW